MSKLFTIGEILIDFIAMQKDCKVKDAISFEKVAGGAPANVAIGAARLGLDVSMITQVGEDAFGDYLIEVLKNNNVDIRYVFKTNKANTSLAFVSVSANGQRDFSFYRNPSADLLLSPQNIKNEWFSKGNYLHFCSADLVESPMKEAHKQAIKFVKEKDGVISFDPNVRLSLWSNPLLCKKAINEFLPLAHIVKISDEELEFITRISDEQEALKSLFIGDVKVILYTKGENGATILTKENIFNHPGYKVKVEDTTGAGDAFTSAILYTLISNNVGVKDLISFVKDKHELLLNNANASGAITTTGKGAISSLPTLSQLKKFIENN